ncbi:hypothetical protein HMPREF0454_02434 [Hafnia alvei ATCC 51873]|uniref:Uncharacterized protein n=1 Tax=Hafnia alvei ATCC 51873 TaxID=1002364 RepID=G9Y761_HAFAL|nr:hypothetical protein HMPREF0454_02434 [Hafnia alvei ATCC 51873]
MTTPVILFGVFNFIKNKPKIYTLINDYVLRVIGYRRRIS